VIPLPERVLKRTCDPLNAAGAHRESGERSAVRLWTQIWILQVSRSSAFYYLVYYGLLYTFFHWGIHLRNLHNFQSLILEFSNSCAVELWECDSAAASVETSGEPSSFWGTRADSAAVGNMCFQIKWVSLLHSPLLLHLNFNLYSFSFSRMHSIKNWTLRMSK